MKFDAHRIKCFLSVWTFSKTYPLHTDRSRSSLVPGSNLCCWYNGTANKH